MSVLRYGAPLVTIALLTLIAALPWGLPSDYRFFLPLLPAVAIHYWSVRRDDLAIEWLAFLSGLVLDVLTQGPLGYWSLIYLLSRVMGLQSVRFSEAGQGVRILLYALALAVTATAAWAISSLYFLEFADWRPYANGAGLAALASLVIVPVLHTLDTPERARAFPNLTRGG